MSSVDSFFPLFNFIDPDQENCLIRLGSKLYPDPQQSFFVTPPDKFFSLSFLRCASIVIVKENVNIGIFCCWLLCVLFFWQERIQLTFAVANTEGDNILLHQAFVRYRTVL